MEDSNISGGGNGTGETGIFEGDNGVDAEIITDTSRPSAPPKQLRKKSVSFTGEDTRQVRMLSLVRVRGGVRAAILGFSRS